MMTLATVLARSGLPVPPGADGITVTGIACDSRQVVPGRLFVAVRGAAQDGRAFIPEAVRRGACAVVTDAVGVAGAGTTPVIRVTETRQAVAALARAWYDDPARDLVMIGVTGTNGKTTVTSLIQHFLQSADRPCGLLGTIESRVGGQSSPSRNTTPGPLDLHAFLAQMRQAGLQACAMEVSSHALDQQRVAGVAFHAAVFTNATPEHLDYHGTFEAYLAAKTRLFADLPSWATAILNAEDPSSDEIQRRTSARVMTFGVGVPAAVRVEAGPCTLEGSEGTLVTPDGRAPFRTALVGRHNLSNSAAAAAAGAACGLSPSLMASALATFPGVPGRLEAVAVGQPFPVFVDYAHTDDALAHLLGALRALTDRRIILVFGCGGDRDRTKRPRMGAVAGRWADRVIVTSDNPRRESPEAIAQAIIEGIVANRSAAVSHTVVLDRAEAIRRALAEADARSLVVIAGKGHETTQVFGDRTVPFDDRQVVRDVLAEIAGVQA